MLFLRWAYRFTKIGIYIWAFIAWATTLSGTGTPQTAFITLFVFEIIDIAVFIFDVAPDGFDLPFYDFGAAAICKLLQIFMFVWVSKGGYAQDFRNFVFLFFSGAFNIYLFVEKARG